jgi:hypothetical protein
MDNYPIIKRVIRTRYARPEAITVKFPASSALKILAK